MAKPKVQIGKKDILAIQAEPVQSIPASAFSDDEIRTRAFQIYESRDRNSNHPDDDWHQAKAELTEMLGGK